MPGLTGVGALPGLDAIPRPARHGLDQCTSQMAIRGLDPMISRETMARSRLLVLQPVERVLGLAGTQVLGRELEPGFAAAEQPVQQRALPVAPGDGAGERILARVEPLLLLVQVARHVRDVRLHHAAGSSFGGLSSRRSNSGSASTARSGWILAWISGIERRTSNLRFMLNVDSRRPSFSRNAEKLRSWMLPRTTISSHSVAYPAIWMLASY